MKNAIITGASGFVGSHIVEACLQNNIKPFAAIRKTSNTKYLQHPDIQILYLNLNHKDELKEQLNQFLHQHGHIDYIIHNAGITKAKKLTDFYEHNYQTTVNLVDAILELNIPIKKFIYISSLAAWGAGNPTTLEPVKNSDTPNPKTIYGRSKLLADEYIQSKNLPWIIFRPTGIYGPRDIDYLEFFKTIQKGIEPYIGFKKQYLTFIYVKDLARLICLALSSNIVQKSYFVSDGNVYTSEEFARITKTILNKKTIPIRIPLILLKIIVFIIELCYKPFGRTPVLNKDKYYILSALNWKCDIEPTLQDFNFIPQYNLTTGVKETIEWYKQHQWLK
ncbi:MAG: NAD(P)-dependent oxidoreductase [Bacteroidales bacterium]|nr:NAD(P)-dependent oxidoreductase [Bacteroidales bacterium]